MIFLFKKALISLFSAIIEGFRFCSGLIFGLFPLVFGSARAIDDLVLRHIITPIYKLFWRAKRRIAGAGQSDGKDGGFAFVARYLTLFLFAATSVFFSWSNIINAQSGEGVLDNGLPVFAISNGVSEEELVTESPLNANPSKTVSVGNKRYLENAPVLGQADASLGVPIDCDSSCEELGALPTAMEDSTFSSPAIASLDLSQGGSARRKIEGYQVQTGDTLSSIAAKFSLNVNTILWANNLYYWNVIRPGQTLVIPPTDGVLHKIAKGENLSKIASKYKVEVTQILAYNDVDEEDALTIGEQLMVPGGKKATQAYYAPYSSPKTTVAYQFGGSSGLIWPATAKRITQYFTWRHHAIDIGAPYGSPIYAIESGIVEYAGWGTGYGWQVVINHGNGMKTRYAHTSWMYVKRGDIIEKGQAIAKIGSSGWSTGPHLHIEIYINGSRVNPLTYLK